jgi:hypothetical protein
MKKALLTAVLVIAAIIGLAVYVKHSECSRLGGHEVVEGGQTICEVK